jgi:HAD superfamily hydrolase (TIGR01450 family)
LKKRPILRNKDLFLFDLDGVFYRGKENRERIGGTRAIEALRRSGKKLFVLTNNSTDSVETVHARLTEFSIPVEREEILTSALLTAEYLSKKHGKVSYFLIGEAGLEAEMRRCGHTRTEGEDAQFVVVGLDRRLTYDKLDRAARLVRNGASIVATHTARLYMYSDGPAIATGPIVRALEYATQRKATVIGKPSPLMFRIALERAGCAKGQAVMIGDQVDTDLEGASRAGIDSILVTSGVDQDALGTAVATIPNVDDLVDLL